MRSEFDDLVAKFPDLGHSEVILTKEVYAHFGLTFYVFGLLEHAVMNCIVANRLYEAFSKGSVKTPGDWESEWDRQEPLVHDLTFGQLVREVASIPEFAEVTERLAAANQNRNYFAHRLFREVAEYFVSLDGCKLLLVRIARTRERIEGLVHEVDRCRDVMLVRMKLPALDEARLAEMHEAAVARGAAEIAMGAARFGWDP